MKLSFVQKIYLIIGLVGALLIAASISSYYRFSITNKILKDSTKPNINLSNVKNLNRRLKDLESNAKSYCLTQDTLFLINYYDNAIKIEQQFFKLRKQSILSLDVVKLDSLINEKTTILDSLVFVQKESNPSDALSEVLRKIKKSNQTKAKKSFWSKVFKKKSSQPKNTDISNEINIVKANEEAKRKQYLASERKLLMLDNDITEDINEIISAYEKEQEELILKNATSTKNAIDESQTIVLSIVGIIILLLFLLIVIVVQYVRTSLVFRNSLKEERNKAQELAKSKEQFLANMSHEIRTPMNAVVGFVEQIGNGPLTNEQQGQLNMVKKSADHLLYVINDILSITKIQSGKLVLEEIPFNPNATFNEVYESAKQLNGNKAVSININQTVLSSDFYAGDPHRLKQILLNIIGNAIKFTKKGEVALSLSEQQLNNQESILNFTVKDSGIGMTEEQLGKVFNEFEQAESNISRNYGGSGLGLSIAKKLVELQHGEIKVSSQPNQGTSISVLIPYSATKTPKQSKKINLNQSLDLTNKSILIVDDEPFNRKLLLTILKKYKGKFYEATNGLEAIEILEKNTIDIILMDNYMPELDGVKATGRIRLLTDETKATTPIIVISAAVTKEDTSRYFEAGIDAFLPKPFKEKELVSKINLILNGKKETSFEDNKEPKTIKDNLTLSHLKELSDNDNEFYSDLLKTFIDSTIESNQKLKEAINDKDLKNIAHYSHKMCPGLRHVGAQETVNLLKDIEKIARSEKQTAAIPLLYNEIESSIKNIISVAKKEFKSL